MHVLDSRIYLFRIQRVPFAEAKTSFYFHCNKEDLKITLLTYTYEILRKKRNHIYGNDYYWNQSRRSLLVALSLFLSMTSFSHEVQRDFDLSNLTQLW